MQRLEVSGAQPSSFDLLLKRLTVRSFILKKELQYTVIVGFASQLVRCGVREGFGHVEAIGDPDV
jgi:hypothetical protein